MNGSRCVNDGAQLKTSFKKARPKARGKTGTNSSMGSSMSSGSQPSRRVSDIGRRKPQERKRKTFIRHDNVGAPRSYDDSDEDSIGSSSIDSNDSGYRRAKQRKHSYMNGTSPKKRNKVNAAITPMQGDDTIMQSTGGQERNMELKNENEQLRMRIRELQEFQEKINNGMAGKYSGKNKIRKKDGMTATDRLNCTQINSYLKNDLFPYIKFLPPKWMKYSNNEKSLCGRIMKLIGVPEMTDPKTYWENMVCPMINEKWCTVRANVKESIRIQYLG